MAETFRYAPAETAVAVYAFLICALIREEVIENDGYALLLPLFFTFSFVTNRWCRRGAWRIVRRDHANHKSPNCAWSEAAAAGALGIQLGGTHLDFGKPVEKPAIGDALRPATSGMIRQTCRMMTAATLLAAGICAACALGLAL